MNNTAIIIPARYASSRFPGKPLVQIAGKTMIQRVWEIACKAHNAENVYIATDDERIKNKVEEFGGKCLMTSAECKNGSERVKDAIDQLEFKPEIIVNFQGDAVRIPPEVLAKLIAGLKKQESFLCATPAVKIENQAYEEFLEFRKQGSTSGTFVTFNKDFKALYFSNAVIPFYRKDSNNKSAWKHIGIYAYRYQGLEKYLALPESSLEATESLEQLRLLENGIDILVVPVDLGGVKTCSVDNPEDVAIAEAIIKEQGEI